LHHTGTQHRKCADTDDAALMQANVFKVCDEPHPVLVGGMVDKCLKGDLVSAHWDMMGLCNHGYATSDVITTVFRVVRGYKMEEFLKLEFMREVGYCQMRISEGVNSRLQLSGMLAKLCKLSARAQRR
jgi:replication factor C subunit 2/4